MNRNDIANTLAIVAILVGYGSAASAAPVIGVPGDQPTLSAAIAVVPDGGIIELAPGTYTAPAPSGFDIENPDKHFTIRAATPLTAILSGSSVRPILRYAATTPALAGHVTFRDLVFRDGLSTTDGLGGGVTLTAVEATFIGCSFESNSSQAPTTGGGGAFLWQGATGFFFDSVFQGNDADNEGGGLRVDASTAWIHDTLFDTNRVNLPGHRSSSAGGGVHATNATLRISNSRFSDNEAGYAGGGIYVLGTWAGPVDPPSAHAIVVGSTFVGNQVVPAGGVTPPGPTEGGAIHIEDEADLYLWNSRFLENQANLGGGLSLYRSVAEVTDSVFLGNAATGGPGLGLGGAIKATCDDTPIDGAVNRRVAELTVTDSLIVGRYGATTTAGEKGAGILALGDSNRAFGINGVSQMGTVASNRALVALERVALVDTDVAVTGGGFELGLADLLMLDSMVLGSDAAGGGGGRLVFETTAAIDGSIFAGNSTGGFGGGMYVQGAHLDFSNGALVQNVLTSGTIGAAMFSAGLEDFPTAGQSVDTTGTISGSIVSGNSSVQLFEDDRHAGPINDLRYDGNTFHGASPFTNVLVGAWTVAQLNSGTVVRSSAPDTVKSTVDNTQAGAAPIVGEILALPPEIVPAAVGDPAALADAYLAFAWSGAAATLDGGSVSGFWGWQQDDAGAHTLAVGGTPFEATIALGPTPQGDLGASPVAIDGGESSTLSWGTLAGTPLTAAVDHGVSTGGATSGSVSVSPEGTRTYRLHVLTEEGGDVQEITVFVDEPAGDVIFIDGFESGDITAWN